MKRIYHVINLLPVKEILNIRDDPDFMFGEGVYIQMYGNLECADDVLYIPALKTNLLSKIEGKKDYNKKIYKVPGFEFNGI